MQARMNLQDMDQKSLQDFTDIFNSQTVIDGKAYS